MATKIFTNEALVSGTLESTEITDVGDLVLDVQLSAGLPQGKSLKYEVKAKEGSNDYKNILNEKGEQIAVSTSGSSGFRLNIKGVDSESAKLFIIVPETYTGTTVTVEATKSTNPNAGW